jgi:hypothetical protein
MAGLSRKLYSSVLELQDGTGIAVLRAAPGLLSNSHSAARAPVCQRLKIGVGVSRIQDENGGGSIAGREL